VSSSLTRSPRPAGGRCAGRIARALLLTLAAIALMISAAWLKWRPAVVGVESHELASITAGRAVSIDDGDSFVLQRTDGVRVRVRLHAIDAPELAQPYGPAARDALSRQLDGALLALDCYKRDARRRAVCRVGRLIGDGRSQDVELAMLAGGHAWHYAAFSSEQRAAERDAYAAAQARARADGAGLWQRSDPMPPWACRERLREARSCS
jgi:endonuclease YncB( thermonuclease family)